MDFMKNFGRFQLALEKNCTNSIILLICRLHFLKITSLKANE